MKALKLEEIERLNLTGTADLELQLRIDIVPDYKVLLKLARYQDRSIGLHELDRRQRS